MTETILQIPADLKKVETQSNGKLKLTFISQENLPVESRSKMIGLVDQYGWLAFLAGENNIKPDEIIVPPLEKPIDETKSPSQRLRGVIYRFWEQRDKPTDTFEEYYRMHMEKLIDQYKEKLT